MKLEDQVTNLKLSKKLKELRVKQDSLLYWVDKTLAVNQFYDDLPSVYLSSGESYLWENPDTLLGEFGSNKVFSAFTVAELGEILKDWNLNDCVDSTELPHYENYAWNILVRGSYKGDCKTEANARAKMLIYLLENKIIK
jgi:hypothetical protein